MIEGIENYRKAGSIARKVKDYAKSIIKKGTPLIEIAEKIENRIIKRPVAIAVISNLFSLAI